MSNWYAAENDSWYAPLRQDEPAREQPKKKLLRLRMRLKKQAMATSISMMISVKNWSLREFPVKKLPLSMKPIRRNASLICSQECAQDRCES